MLETPQIVRTSPLDTAIIHLTVPREEIQNVMGPGLRELMAAIAAQGIAPAGPWFTHHLKMAPGIFDFEISIPVTTPVKAAGRVQPSQWPAMTVARTVYHGGFEGLGDAWGDFGDWIKAQGHTTAEDLWERYLVGHDVSSDPADFRTELNRRLV